MGQMSAQSEPSEHSPPHALLENRSKIMPGNQKCPLCGSEEESSGGCDAWRKIGSEHQRLQRLRRHGSRRVKVMIRRSEDLPVSDVLELVHSVGVRRGASREAIGTGRRQGLAREAITTTVAGPSPGR
jgi:hypothetical protein